MIFGDIQDQFFSNVSNGEYREAASLLENFEDPADVQIETLCQDFLKQTANIAPYINDLDIDNPIFLAIRNLLNYRKNTKLDLPNIIDANTDLNFPVLALTCCLRGANVTHLDLRNNNISNPDELTALAEGLKGTNVTYLDLTSNNINTPEAFTALGEGLRGANVTHLNLSCSAITLDELTALADGLRGTNVTHLNIGLISNENADNIIFLLQKNRHIIELNIQDHKLSEENLLRIKEQIYLNKGIDPDSNIPNIPKLEHLAMIAVLRNPDNLKLIDKNTHHKINLYHDTDGDLVNGDGDLAIFPGIQDKINAARNEIGYKPPETNWVGRTNSRRADVTSSTSVDVKACCRIS